MVTLESRIKDTNHWFTALRDGDRYSTGDRIRQKIEWDTDSEPAVVLSINWYNYTNQSPILKPMPEHLTTE